MTYDKYAKLPPTDAMCRAIGCFHMFTCIAYIAEYLAAWKMLKRLAAKACAR